MVREGVAHRFHAMRKLDTKQDDYNYVFLDGGVDLRIPRVRAALQLLCDCAGIRLVGARLLPERSHRPLLKDLQDLLQSNRN